MNRDDIQKLLGGYATGTLTEAEQKTLFEAAMYDQKLFDALAGEEGLRQLLRDPSAKAELLRAVEPAPAKSVLKAWLRRPMGWAAVGSLAAATALITIMVLPDARHSEPHLAAVQEEIPSSEPHLAPFRPSEPEAVRTEVPRPPQVSESLRRKAMEARAPVRSAPEREAVARPQSDRMDVAAAPAPQVLNVAPTDPMSAVATFRQTAPQVSSDAAEVRAEKARSGLGLTAMRNTAGAPPMAIGASGVRYELQQRGESGMYQRVDPDLPLRSSAPLRLEAETNKAGYLYAFETSPDGGYRQLSIGPTVDAHVKHTVELGEPSPDRKLLLVFSVRPEAAFTVGAATEGAARELDRLRAQTALNVQVRQKSANSVYVVGPASPLLLVEVSLPGVQ